jgi:TPR repeat protein
MMTNSVARSEQLIRSGKIQAAIEILEGAAQSGDSEAMLRLGLLYFKGVHVPKDGTTAWNWFESADKAGQVRAPYYLAALYGSDDGYDVLLAYLERGAERGHHSAMARLGYQYLHGVGVQQSNDKAFEYFTKAKLAGNFSARAQIARMLASGHKGIGGYFLMVYEVLSGFGAIFKFAASKHYESTDDMRERFLA